MATRTLSFEHDLHQTLDFIPLCVRRKLDLAALKLSLEGWRKLDLEARRALRDAQVTDDASAESFAESLRKEASRASIELVPRSLEGAPRWRSQGVPGPLSTRLAEAGVTLDDRAWRALDDEDRYLLLALAEKRREPERFDAAVNEILGRGPG